MFNTPSFHMEGKSFTHSKLNKHSVLAKADKANDVSVEAHQPGGYPRGHSGRR